MRASTYHNATGARDTYIKRLESRRASYSIAFTPWQENFCGPPSPIARHGQWLVLNPTRANWRKLPSPPLAGWWAPRLYPPYSRGGDLDALDLEPARPTSCGLNTGNCSPRERDPVAAACGAVRFHQSRRLGGVKHRLALGAMYCRTTERSAPPRAVVADDTRSRRWRAVYTRSLAV